MSEQVRLMLCLSAQPSFIKLTERHIRNLVDPITTAVDIRLLPSSGDIRALLHLQNQAAADRLALNLHGITTQLGRVGIYDVDAVADVKTALYGSREVFGHFSLNTTQFPFSNCAASSDKKALNCKVRVSNTKCTDFKTAQVLQSTLPLTTVLVKPRSNGLVAKSPAFDAPNKENHEIDTKQQVSGTTLDSVQRVEPCADAVITVTHQDAAQLVEKKVLKAFRRFGRIFGMQFNDSKATWVLQYGSVKEVRKVAKVLANNKLFGYTLHPEDKLSAVACDAEEYNAGSSSQPTSNQTKLKLVNAATSSARRSTLRIDYSGSTLNFEALCLAVAKVHKPSEASACLDPVRNQSFALMHFAFLFEAAEVLVELGRTCEGVRARFAN